MMTAREHTSTKSTARIDTFTGVGGWLSVWAGVFFVIGIGYVLSYPPIVRASGSGIQSLFEYGIIPAAALSSFATFVLILSRKRLAKAAARLTVLLVLVEMIFMNATSFYISRHSGAIDGYFNNSSPYPLMNVIFFAVPVITGVVVTFAYFARSRRAAATLTE